jgi:ribosomal protein S27AE
VNTPVPPLPEPPRGPRTPDDPRPEITHAECRQCGTLIAGLDGRYSCGVCGWVNHHSEGHRPLPRAEDDTDHSTGESTNRLS